MINVRHALYVIGIALCGAFMAAGCRSSNIAAMGGSKFTTAPLGENPFGPGSEPMILRLSSDAFIVARSATETELRIEKYSRDLALEWSTPLPINPSRTSFTLFAGLDGIEHFAGEEPGMLLQRNGHLILLSLRRGDDDSIYAVGRIFDIASGKLLHTRTIDSVPRQKEISHEFRYYRSAISSDSNHIVFYTHGYDPGKNVFTMRIAQTDDDLSYARSRIVPLDNGEDLQDLPELAIDPAGDIYVASRSLPDTIRITKYDFKGLSPARSAFVVFSDSTNSSAHAGGSTIYLGDRNDMTVIAPMHDDGDILGSASTTFDRTQFTFGPVKFQALSEAKLEQLFDNDEYSDAFIHSALESDNNKSRYILCLEQMAINYGKSRIAASSSVKYKTGDVLLMAFDRSGQPTWQQGIRKSFGPIDVVPTLFTIAPQVTDKGTLRTVYRDGSSMVATEYRLDDGAEVPGSRRELLDMDLAAFNRGSATTWLDDSTLLLLLRQGVASKDWSLGLVQVR